MSAVSLHQGRGGVIGPMGIIGPTGSAVCIVMEISFTFSLVLFFSKKNGVQSLYRVLEERRAIVERL